MSEKLENKYIKFLQKKKKNPNLFVYLKKDAGIQLIETGDS